MKISLNKVFPHSRATCCMSFKPELDIRVEKLGEKLLPFVCGLERGKLKLFEYIPFY